MCVLALALDTHRRFPLVLAANRDEFFARPAVRLAWWKPDDNSPLILSGRDLMAGGTWLGLTAEGRLAMLTNIRNPARHEPSAPSRGLIVPQWLAAKERPDQFWTRVAMTGHNGFNLIAADFRRGECFWASSLHGMPRRLERGLYGLSNASLDTPWPKVKHLKTRVREALTQADSVDGLADRLFTALADRHPVEDPNLPSTGIPLALERQLSPAFVRTIDGQYGTRCSTVVISERLRRHTVTHVLERTFSASGGMALLRRTTLTHWPPRYEWTAHDLQPEVHTGEVSETEGEDTAKLANSSAVATKRTRVRSLLKPDLSPRRR